MPFVEAGDLPAQYRHRPIPGVRQDFSNPRENFIDRSTTLQENGGKVLAVRVRGKLVRADNEERAARPAALFDLSGWEIGALWDEIKFDIKHFVDIATGTKTGTKLFAQISESRKYLILLVGGAGFEPATLGL